jgi:hypothetical protein
LSLRLSMRPMITARSFMRPGYALRLTVLQKARSPGVVRRDGMEDNYGARSECRQAIAANMHQHRFVPR